MRDGAEGIWTRKRLFSVLQKSLTEKYMRTQNQICNSGITNTGRRQSDQNIKVTETDAVGGERL